MSPSQEDSHGRTPCPVPGGRDLTQTGSRTGAGAAARGGHQRFTVDLGSVGVGVGFAGRGVYPRWREGGIGPS